MLKNKYLIFSCVWAVCCVALIIFYATAYPAHLSWQEQNQIFLNTPHWLASYFDKPAWLGTLLGDWLTQFYHNTIIGAIILTLAIAYCSGAFAIGMLRLLPKILAWALTAIFTLFLVACSMSASTSLTFYICTACGITLGLINLCIPVTKSHKLNLSPILVVLAYWAFGFGGLLTAAFIILFILKSGINNREKVLWWLPAIFALILGISTPAFLCQAYALPYAKALTYPGIAKPSFPQMEFERRIAIADAFYHRDYEQTKQLSLKTDTPNDVSAFYYYLASAMQDSLPDNLLKYPLKTLGTLTTIGDTTPLPVINMMNDLYYELGDMTYAERAAMMRNVFSPRNRNVRMICRLAEINLISGDTLAALKYLRILDKTHFYADWSRNHKPGATSSDVTADILRRRSLSNDKDNIRLGDNCRNIILELLESNPDDTVALDYLLCTDLLLKDMDTFKMDYDTYCMAKGKPRYKKLYQEALMIYLAGTEASAEEWNRYINSDSLVQSFNRYSNRRGDPAFSDTYWYYFDRQSLQ